MGEFEDILNSILSSPGEMEKIMGLARELTGGAGDKSAGAPPPEPEPRAPQWPGDLDPKLLKAMGRVMGQLRSRDGGKEALAEAMGPYLRPERRRALDRAVKIARIARAARAAISELGGDFDFDL